MKVLDEWQLFIQTQCDDDLRESCTCKDVSFDEGYAYLERFLDEHFIGERLPGEKLITRTPERSNAMDYHLIPSDEQNFKPPRWKPSQTKEITLSRVRAGERIAKT
ncbi:hypothetical protein [Ruegeria sp.]|uniref:hypothetical protein n=1 Tax=Ruegeria sp. TaxID=1879320 RepID=UPI003C7D7B04